MRGGLLPSRYFPPMTETGAALGDQLGQSCASGRAIAHTLEGWAIGLAIAIAIAVPLGLALGFNEFLYRAFRPAIEFLRPVPSVALIPLAILVYGTGLQSKVFLVAFACDLAAADPDHLRRARPRPDRSWRPPARSASAARTASCA